MSYRVKKGIDPKIWHEREEQRDIEDAIKYADEIFDSLNKAFLNFRKIQNKTTRFGGQLPDKWFEKYQYIFKDINVLTYNIDKMKKDLEGMKKIK